MLQFLYLNFLKLQSIIKINLIYRYNHVIAACGSTHVHISFMKENTSYIE